MKTLYYFFLTVISIAIFFLNMVFIEEVGAVGYWIILISSSFGMITGLKYFAENKNTTRTTILYYLFWPKTDYSFIGADYISKARLFPFGIMSIILSLNHPFWKINKRRTISTLDSSEQVYYCHGFFTFPWLMYFRLKGYSLKKNNMYIW